MRICITDYSGHPFQVQLSRALARRNHDVLHLHFAEFQTPKGRLKVESGDVPSLQIEGVSLGRPFSKYNFLKRRFQEIEVGRLLAQRIEAFQPDIVVGSNLPIDTLTAVMRSCRAHSRPFVFWQQDIYSTAIRKVLNERYGLLGRLVGDYYRSLERRAVLDSSAIVVIANDFRQTLVEEFGASANKIHIIENWAPLEEIVPGEKKNAWSLENGFADRKVVLYTGTLGLKHDPNKILLLAEALKDQPDVSVVVTSEGPSADWLKCQAEERALRHLRVLPFQPYDIYSDVLASADVLISVLEADAGAFSVPSKILSYLCASRAIVLTAPLENLASRTIQRAGAGEAVASGDDAAFISAVGRLLADPALRSQNAKNGRAYAEQAFDIEKISARFVDIFELVRADIAPG